MRIWVAITVFAIMAQAPAAGLAQGASASYSVAIETPMATVKVGSEIVVNIALTNLTDQGISVDMEAGGRGEFDFTINVNDSAGRPAAYSEYYRAVKGQHETGRPMVVVTYSSGPHPVKARGVLKDTVQLDKLYDLSQPGKYTVQLERVDVLTKILVKSNQITVTVTP